MSRLAVAVVGAGPAGSTAARLLASQGAQVILLEARDLPRGKICGGGLTPKAQRLVPPGALDAVERRIHRVEIRGGYLQTVRLDEPAAEIAMVDRAAFDLALAEAAAAAGVEVRDGERVDRLAEDELGVTLETRRGRIRVDFVIAADGDPSAMAHQLGLAGAARRRSLALNINLPLATAWPADSAVISFTVAGGYAWYFPKGDHASIGVASAHAMARNAASVATLRRSLRAFAESAGLDAADGRVTGHWVPQGLRRGCLATRRVVLAGDAAATADPLLGEGITNAIISGVVASQVIGELEAGTIADLRVYDARLRELLDAPMRRLALAAFSAEWSTTLALLTLRLCPWVQTYAVNVVTGRRRPFAIDSPAATGASPPLTAAYALLRTSQGQRPQQDP